MKIDVTLWKRLVVQLAVAACFLADAAHAATVTAGADFNNDGIVDHVVLAAVPSPHIVVQLSGEAPQVLKLRSAALSIVAMDIDHDGHLDLTALSERQGIITWLNKNGRGRFAVLKRKPVRRWAALTGQPLMHAGERDERSLAQAVPDATGKFASRPHPGTFVPPLSGCSLLVASDGASPSRIGAFAVSRGPPSDPAA